MKVELDVPLLIYGCPQDWVDFHRRPFRERLFLALGDELVSRELLAFCGFGLGFHCLCLGLQASRLPVGSARFPLLSLPDGRDVSLLLIAETSGDRDLLIGNSPVTAVSGQAAAGGHGPVAGLYAPLPSVPSPR